MGFLLTDEYPERDLNPHAAYATTDFKSVASAISPSGRHLLLTHHAASFVSGSCSRYRVARLLRRELTRLPRSKRNAPRNEVRREARISSSRSGHESVGCVLIASREIRITRLRLWRVLGRRAAALHILISAAAGGLSLLRGFATRWIRCILAL